MKININDIAGITERRRQRDRDIVTEIYNRAAARRAERENGAPTSN